MQKGGKKAASRNDKTQVWHMKDDSVCTPDEMDKFAAKDIKLQGIRTMSNAFLREVRDKTVEASD